MSDAKTIRDRIILALQRHYDAEHARRRWPVRKPLRIELNRHESLNLLMQAKHGEYALDTTNPAYFRFWGVELHEAHDSKNVLVTADGKEWLL